MSKKNTALNTEELKEKYGMVYEIEISIEIDDFTTAEKSYIFKKPTMISYDRFVKAAGNSPTKASKAFCLDNIIPESAAELEADIEEYPALIMTLTDKLFSLLGLSKDIQIKKL